jgi:hypothetical protein
MRVVQLLVTACMPAAPPHPEPAGRTPERESAGGWLAAASAGVRIRLWVWVSTTAAVSPSSVGM